MQFLGMSMVWYGKRGFFGNILLIKEVTCQVMFHNNINLINCKIYGVLLQTVLRRILRTLGKTFSLINGDSVHILKLTLPLMAL